MKASIKQFITTKTAAKELGLATRTIQAFIKEGKLPASKFAGTYFINRKIFEEWKARNIITV